MAGLVRVVPLASEPDPMADAGATGAIDADCLPAWRWAAATLTVTITGQQGEVQACQPR